MRVKVEIVPNKKRACWIWKQTKWSDLRQQYRNTKWDTLFDNESVDDATTKITD